MTERIVPVISLKEFNSRKNEITQQLVNAAESAGFLTLIDHGITIEEIEQQFAISKGFFGLPHDIKGKTPHSTESNNGWEYKASHIYARKKHPISQ
ncbi:hypothetical protein FE257_010756 [Aspergillus nanangensis]|uniref:Non-haem dioxygenase N-terminal domain-containing protein n=1 Tax=Aspergillus nanangensis TaxID=2582783 RepID=A0AAD4GX45_ASPNN|nr:hypothetical protein FE257_010756 [Aspergillus nanangensis]